MTFQQSLHKLSNVKHIVKSTDHVIKITNRFQGSHSNQYLDNINCFVNVSEKEYLHLNEFPKKNLDINL